MSLWLDRADTLQKASQNAYDGDSMSVCLYGIELVSGECVYWNMEKGIHVEKRRQLVL